MKIALDEAAQAFARHYGLRLRYMREALGESAADVAHALDVVPGAVSAWERGDAVPHLYRAMRLQSYLRGVAKAKGVKFGKLRRDALAAQHLQQQAERAA